MALCVCLLPLSLMISGFTQVVACSITPFLFMAAYYSIIWIKHDLFIQSSVNEPLGHIHLLAVVNSVAVHTHG